MKIRRKIPFSIVLLSFLLMVMNTAYAEDNRISTTIEANSYKELNFKNLSRIYTGVYVTDFGVKRDANFFNEEDGMYYKDRDFSVLATDDKDAINEAIKYARKKRVRDVYIPSGNYLIDPIGKRVSHDFEYAVNGGIQLENNINLIMNDDTKLVMNTASTPGYSLITVEKKENVKIIGGVLVGDINTHPDNTNTYCHGITIAHASQNVLIAYTEITQMEDDGIMIADYLEHLSDARKTSGVQIRKIKSHGNGRQGLTISTGSDMRIVDNEFSNQRKHSPMSGIDIELESFDHEGVKNIEIKRNIFKDNAYSGIIISDSFNDRPKTMSENIVISDNTIENSRFGIIAPGKVTNLDISRNDIYIEHLEREFTAAIGTTSRDSREVTIHDNKITSSNPDNYSTGIINLAPGADIEGNFIEGQRKPLWLTGNEGTVADNTIKNQTRDREKIDNDGSGSE